MQKVSLYFTGPCRVEVKTEEQAEPKAGEVLVGSLYSAISAGTEMLFYRGEFPENMELDTQIKNLRHLVKYPFKYGYAAVGRVLKTGSGVASGWLGKHVFALHPHESHFTATPDELLILPDGLAPAACLFYPFCETAVNFLLDGRPLIGEDVLVIGQGIIGLFTAALLKKFPLQTLITIDKLPLRRVYSNRLGVDYCFALDAADAKGQADTAGAAVNIRRQEPVIVKPDSHTGVSRVIRDWLNAKRNSDGLDLIYELSGDMDAINLALSLAGFNSRIIIGSWYGRKGKELYLGGDFHRKRIRLKSSQVSTFTPELTGRWDKTRRSSLTWQTLKKLQPEMFITHTFPFEHAAAAYRLVDRYPDQALQVVLKYENSLR